MADYIVAIICIAICTMAIIISSSVKWIVSAVAKRKGKTINKKVFEYPLFALSLALAFGGVFLLIWQLFGVDYSTNGLTGYKAIAMTSGEYAGSIQSLYMILQALRKSGKLTGAKLIALGASIVKLIKSKKKVEDAPNAISEIAETVADNTAEDTTQNDIIASAKSLFDTVIRPHK